MTRPLPAAIPPVLRSLCAKLALERTRADQWRLAGEFCRQVQARLDAGQAVDQLVADLNREIAAALAGQRNG
jgi:hypothetical protein